MGHFHDGGDIPYLLGCLLGTDSAFGGNGIPHLIRDPYAGRPGAEHHHAEV